MTMQTNAASHLAQVPDPRKPALEPVQPKPSPEPAPKKRSWLRRAIVYLRDPKILLGGALAFVIVQGVEYLKTELKFDH